MYRIPLLALLAALSPLESPAATNSVASPIATPSLREVIANPSAFIVPNPPIQKRGSLSLAWNKSPDISVVGYRIYFGTNSGIYMQTVRVGNTTSATLNGLEEGTKYFVTVTAYDAIGLESANSNEISGTTGFYVYLEQYVWNVKEWGVFGKTNQVLTSTDLLNWTPILTWVGNGKLTNVLHTNATRSYFRGVVK